MLRRVPPVGVVDVLLGQAAPVLEGQVEEVQRLRRQVRLSRLPAVERAATRAAGGPAGSGELRVVLLPDRAAMRFSFEHPDEDAARRGVLAAVGAYDEVRITERRQRILLDLARTDAALAATAVAGAVERVALRNALAERRARLLVLRDSREGLTALTVDVKRPFSTTPLRGGLAGAVAGLFPAVFLAHRSARRGLRLRRPEAVDAALGAPGLSVLEPFRPGRPTSPDSQIGAAYAVAAEGLMLLPHAPGGQSVAVVGAGAADRWVSTVTADLALALVRCGRHVCVVDTGAGGAEDRLTATPTPAAPENTSAQGSLVQVKAGESWPDPGRHDIVLVDAPAAATRASALAATARAGSALVVVDGQVTREELRQVAERLAQIGVRPVGHLQVRRRGPESVLDAAADRLRRRPRLASSPLLAST